MPSAGEADEAERSLVAAGNWPNPCGCPRLVAQSRAMSADDSISGGGAWVPSPTYLLRRDWVLRLLGGLPRGRLIEVGCGAGGLLRDCAQLGFHCVGLETSPTAIAAAREMTTDVSDVEIVSMPEHSWSAAFDFLLAFEVIEHIEDDLGALRRWTSWLRPGGSAVLSVPAHKSRWNSSDEWAGHVRRYEREELSRLVEAAGLQVESLVCYGFPLSNLLQPLRGRVHRRQLDTPGDDALTRTARVGLSGVERSTERRLYPLLASRPGRLAMAVFSAAQRPFFRTELGNGYLCHAVKEQA